MGEVLTTVDPDRWRQNIGGKRHYRIGDHPPMPSATSIKPEQVFKTKTPLGSLVPLDALRVAEHVLDQRERIDQLDPDILIEELSTAPEIALRAAAGQGTQVHDAISADILGHHQPTPLSDNARPFYDAYHQFALDYRPTWIATEVIAVVPDVGVAGTIDAIGQFGGRVVLIDWKTRGRRHGCYPEEVAQLGLYLAADELIVGSHPGRSYAMPAVEELAVVSLLWDGSYALYPVDREAALEAARAMHNAWTSRQAITETGRQAIGSPVVTAPTNDGNSDGEVGLAERVDWIRARVKALTAPARADAVRTWPTEAPKQAAAICSHTEVDTIADHLAAVEASHGLPFHTGDPAKQAKRPPRK